MKKISITDSWWRDRLFNNFHVNNKIHSDEYKIHDVFIKRHNLEINFGNVLLMINLAEAVMFSF
jgi:hypothetical protein